MRNVAGSGMLPFDTINIDAVESLFQSEGLFWLTTAMATGLAAEEMERFCAKTPQVSHTAQIVELFNQCIRNNDISAAELTQARQWSMENLGLIDSWNRQTVVFQERCSLGISRGFTAYWLNYKLIELEWQQVLGSEEIEETYQFLNQVLADSAELEAIEEAVGAGAVSEDQHVFLRSHWQRSRLFWSNLYSNLQLLSLGVIEMRQPGLARERF